jgi:hypothetical protein
MDNLEYVRSLGYDESMINALNFKPWPFKPIGESNAKNVLEEGCEVLKGLGLNYWLSAGTALGLYRDKGFIPHDTDIDIGICFNESFVNKNQGIIGDIIKNFYGKGFELLRAMSYVDFPSQLAFINKEGIPLDIYFFYDIGHDNVVLNYNEEGILWKLKSMVNDMDTITFEGKEYPVPTPIEDYLTHRYGKWQTPKTAKDIWTNDVAKALVKKEEL